ncbi:1-piperideine-2-carboxylate/1-pyrroline-2-carboxylate reductase [NAD(P)H] OS=Castellaniella defragrans OX=75697 GN=HNR28_001861 PE=4 SV=1 [Castellaniella defragrans]
MMPAEKGRWRIRVNSRIGPEVAYAGGQIHASASSMTPPDPTPLPPALLCDADRTQALLPYPDLMAAIAQAAGDAFFVDQAEASPTPLDGMSAARDAFSANRAETASNPPGGMPAHDERAGQTGKPRLVLDGPTVTTRCAVAVSLLAIRHLMPNEPRHAVVVGTGAQARAHVQALLASCPELRIDVIGHSAAQALAFAGHQGSTLVRSVRAVPEDADLVLLATTSAVPLYDQLPRPDRLIIGVGACRPDRAEIGPRTLSGSRLFVDDLAGARNQAGDLLQARVDWTKVRSLGSLLQAPAGEGPFVFKSVGCAAWNLAAARYAQNHAQGDIHANTL